MLQHSLIDSHSYTDEVSVFPTLRSVCEELCRGPPRKAEEFETPDTSDGRSMAEKEKRIV